MTQDASGNHKCRVTVRSKYSNSTRAVTVCISPVTNQAEPCESQHVAHQYMRLKWGGHEDAWSASRARLAQPLHLARVIDLQQITSLKHRSCHQVVTKEAGKRSWTPSI